MKGMHGMSTEELSARKEEKTLRTQGQEMRALEAAAKLYCALPGYLYEHKDKNKVSIFLLDLINALDVIEFSETGEPFLSMIKHSSLKKQSVLKVTEEYDLTQREMQILSYLSNDRNPTYIAEVLGIAKATAKAHKYSIFKKLKIHSSAELKKLFVEYQ